MLVVIDYNVGNVRSVCNAFRYIGCDVKLSCEPKDIEDAAGLVLPGVAAFGYAMSALGPLAELIKKVARTGKPLLGICVGFQMLFDHNGLGLVSGSVVPIPSAQIVPHMGWNLVKLPEEMDLFAGPGIWLSCRKRWIYLPAWETKNISISRTLSMPTLPTTKPKLHLPTTVLICLHRYKRQIYTAHNFIQKKAARRALKS
jgi:hypothetical protein